MSEENDNQDAEIDLDALQKNIDDSMVDDSPEQVEETVEAKDDENTEDAPENPSFDLSAALDSDEPVVLSGKISDEEAKEEAEKRGWREEGEDKYGHKISAIEFLERAPLFHKMNLMRGDIKEANRQIKKLAEQSKKIAQKSVQDKAALNKELMDAKDDLLKSDILDSDDINKLKSLDSQIEASRADEAENSDDDALVKEYDDALGDFKGEHEWYESNRAMKTLADSLGKEFVIDKLKDGGTLPPPKEMFDYVLDEIKKDFPDMWQPRRQTTVASTRNRTVATQRAKTKTLDDIPEDQRAIAREVMEATGMKEEEYLKTYEF